LDEETSNIAGLAQGNDFGGLAQGNDFGSA